MAKKRKKLTMDNFVGLEPISRKKYIGKYLVFNSKNLELVAYGKDAEKALKRAHEKGVKDTTCIFVDS